MIASSNSASTVQSLSQADWDELLIGSAKLGLQKGCEIALIAYGGITFSSEEDKFQRGKTMKSGNIDLAKQTPAVAAMKAGLYGRLQHILNSNEFSVDQQDLKTLSKLAKEKDRPDLLSLNESPATKRHRAL